jgi:hypothetical protein
MEQGRNVCDVLTIIMKFIPENETNLIDNLNKFSESLWNQAPESLKGYYCWAQLVTILNRDIPNISEDWQIKIKEVINNDNY